MSELQENELENMMSSQTLPSVEITGDRLSDLFFNYEHRNWDEAVKQALKPVAFRNKEALHVEQREALRKDAVAFAETLGITDDDDLVNSLVEDFFDRL